MTTKAFFSGLVCEPNNKKPMPVSNNRTPNVTTGTINGWLWNCLYCQEPSPYWSINLFRDRKKGIRMTKAEAATCTYVTVSANPTRCLYYSKRFYVHLPKV